MTGHDCGIVRGKDHYDRVEFAYERARRPGNSPIDAAFRCLADDLARERNDVAFYEALLHGERVLVSDLKKHLRDRDRHIALLEEQLLPHLTRGLPDAEQEAML